MFLHNKYYSDFRIGIVKKNTLFLLYSILLTSDLIQAQQPENMSPLVDMALHAKPQEHDSGATESMTSILKSVSGEKHDAWLPAEAKTTTTPTPLNTHPMRLPNGKIPQALQKNRPGLVGKKAVGSKFLRPVESKWLPTPQSPDTGE